VNALAVEAHDGVGEGKASASPIDDDLEPKPVIRGAHAKAGVLPRDI
jgi:hypothetical protein